MTTLRFARPSLCASRHAARGARALVLLAAVAACSTERILQADRPDQIDPSQLSTDLQGARALAAGAIGDFTVAYNGGTGGGAGLGQVMASGYLSDEFRFGGTPPELREMDLRNVRAANGAWLNTYLDLHRAREATQRAAGALRAVAASDPAIAEMYSLQGALLVLQAENYCTGAPVSTTQPTITYGPSLTTNQVLALAVSKLDSALGSAGISANVRSLANVLKARAQLDAGQFAAAATTVANVPTSFRYEVSHGLATGRQQSFTWSYMYNTQAFLVSDREGINGLPFATAGDPRLPIDGTGNPSVFDLVTPAYFFRNYNRQNHTVPVATGVEARLIEAEAALQAGNTALFVQKLNEARANYAGMTPTTDPGTAAARVDLLFRERAFSMFATAHRVGDLRRLSRQYNRQPETVWPTGAYHKDNLQRGTDVSIIVPLSESNNPNYTPCNPRTP